MKNIFGLKLFAVSLVILFKSQTLFSQTTNDKIVLLPQLGVTVIPIDNNGGLALGLKIKKSDCNLEFSFRNDIMPVWSRRNIDTLGIISYTGPMYLSKIMMNNYFDFWYSWQYSEKRYFLFGAGFSWLSDGDTGYGTPARRYSKDNGFPAISASIQWKPSWFILEARTNLSLPGEGTDLSGISQSSFVLSFIYEFLPK